MKRSFFIRSLVTIKHAGNDGIAQMNLNALPVNSLNKQLMSDITNAVVEIESNSLAKSLILTSSAKVFSAGLDLKCLYKASNNELSDFWGTLQETLRKLYNSRLLTVAAINGHAIAAGCILSLCCDYRIIDSKSLIGLNETTFGLVVPPFPTQLMLNVVGKRHGERAMSLGKIFNAEEAVALGLVDEIVKKESGRSVVEASTSLIQQLLLSTPPSTDVLARAMMKRKLREPVDKQFFGTDELKRLDIDTFVNMVSDPAVQASLGQYLQSLAARKK